MDWSEIADRLISVFSPQRCLFCGKVVAYDDFLCGKCEEWEESRHIKPGEVDCDFTRNFASALAAFVYNENIRALIIKLKYKADKRILRFFTKEMFDIMEEHWGGIRPDVIVPVPSTQSRLKERGFNQSGMLALYLSRRLKAPVSEDALVRYEDTRRQHDLTAVERKINAFRSYGIGKPDSVDGKTVLLVDDVFTTGSTAAACSDRLLEAGAKRVRVVTASVTHRRG